MVRKPSELLKRFYKDRLGFIYGKKLLPRTIEKIKIEKLLNNSSFKKLLKSISN